MEWEASSKSQHDNGSCDVVVVVVNENPSPANNDSSTSDRKRRHPNSTDQTTIAQRTLTSAEILERIETPNFEELARQYPSFRQAWQATRTQQHEKDATFSACVTQEFTIALTRALLQSYFALKLPYLEEHHLCPPIPNRFFYVHWIHTQLLNNTNNNNNTEQRKFGLDIGAGASCIYPMLAARHFRSTMVTTEIDDKASALARANVQANHLTHFITVLDVPPSYSQQVAEHASQQPRPGGPLQRAVEAMQQQQLQLQPLDFVMTNPPFYDPSSNEHTTARVGDGRARTNMTVSEGTYPGGEVGFVLDLLEDSLRQLCHAPTTTTTHFISPKTWYSSMLGKKTSLVKLQKILTHLLGPAHVQTIEYGPGHYTRWFVAWNLQQPSPTAPNARCSPHDHDVFEVALATLVEQEPDKFHHHGHTTVPDAMKEMVRRTVAFCESTPGGWDLMAQVVPNEQEDQGDELTILHIQETMPQAISKFVDETQTDIMEIPPRILDALHQHENNNDFLPPEGHFLVQVYIRHVVQHHPKCGRGDFFQVQLVLFKHSARGGKAIEKIRSSMAGEVCRTNRKWRKIREREQQQQQHMT
jgi:23S rRNA A1618 N6-methylase RlmF